MAATDMQSDGGTQTEDQDAWMGYNHIHPAVNLAGCGTGSRSPAFQGVHLNPMFFDGFAHVPFFPATQTVQKTGYGTVLGFYASGARGPAYRMVPFGVPWGYRGPFMVHLATTGAKCRREDGRVSETDDDLDNEDTVHLLDEHEALEFVEFDPSVQ